MRLRLVCMTGVLLLAAQAANAQFSMTGTVASDYDFRGESLSALNPNVSVSFDYAFPSGLAVGAWLGNFDYGPGYNGHFETDLYFNYSRPIVKDKWNFLAGGIYYTYPGSENRPNEGVIKVEAYPEIYLGASYKNFSLKQWYTNDYGQTGESGWYDDFAASFPLPQNFTLNLHAGYSWGDYWSKLLGGPVMDFSLGLGYSYRHFNFLAKVTGTTLSSTSGQPLTKGDPFNQEPRFVAAVSTTLPWAKE